MIQWQARFFVKPQRGDGTSAWARRKRSVSWNRLVAGEIITLHGTCLSTAPPENSPGNSRLCVNHRSCPNAADLIPASYLDHQHCLWWFHDLVRVSHT